MPLATTALKNDLKSLMVDMRTRDVDSDEEFATRFAAMMEIYVKSGDGKITTSAMVAGGSPVTATATVLVKTT